MQEKGDNIYEVMNQWVEEIPAEEFCPVYLPFLMASNVHPNALGSFVGMSNFHTRKHLCGASMRAWPSPTGIIWRSF